MKIKLTKAQAKDFVEGKVIKTADDTELKAGALIDVQKDAASVIRAARLNSDISEKAAATALGIESVEDYVAFETGGAPLEINAAGLKALAKTFKMDAVELAAQVIAGDPAKPEGDEPPADPADPVDPPADPVAKAKAKVGKAAAGPSNQIILPPAMLEKFAKLGGAEIEKAEERTALFKGLTGIADRVDLRKDILTPEMFAPNGVIDPKLGTTLFDLTVAADSLMSKIQTKQMTSLKEEVLVWNVGERTARRYDSGVWPTSGQLTEGLNKSLIMSANKINVQFKIDDRTLMNFKGNLAGLENQVIGAFTKSLARQLLDLGFNGTTDTYADSFLTLGTGWITLIQSLAGARAVPAAQIIDVSTGATLLDTPYEVFDEMLKQSANGAAKNYITDDTPFIVGTPMWQRHREWIQTRPDALPVLLAGLQKEYSGHPAEVTSLLADNVAILTPLENLVMGIVTGNGIDGISVERHRVPQATLFVCTVYVDFEVVNPEAIVLAKP